MHNPLRPRPAAPAFGDGKVVPEAQANVLSKLVFSWLAPFLAVGFSRPLEKEDLWQLPAPRLTENLTDRIERNFYARCPPTKRPAFLREMNEKPVGEDEGVMVPEDSKPKDDVELTAVLSGSDDKAKPVDDQTNAEGSAKHHRFQRRQTGETPTDKKGNKKYDESLLRALLSTFFWRWWAAGLMKLAGDTLNTTTPLLNKRLLAWLSASFAFHSAGGAQSGLEKPQGIGYGIGLAFALFAMQEVSSLFTNHYQLTTMTTGLSVRTGTIGAIFRKSLRLSGKARLDHSVGQITTMISTDATRLDRVSAFAHNLWVGPIQIIIGIALLINNLGYSALVGLGVLMLGFPLQFMLVRTMFKMRRKGVQITDSRVRLTGEVLQGIRLVKQYAWEAFYTRQIGGLREREVWTIRRVAMARASLIALVTFIPVAAAVLSFITYALSGHELNVAIIFSSLQFFNIIRSPLTFFPLVLSAAADAVVALGRIGKFLTAEELEEPYAVDEEAKAAVRVDGSFMWETVGKPAEKFVRGRGRGGKGGGGRAEARKRKEEAKKEGGSHENVSTEKAKKMGWFRRGKGPGKDGTVLPSSSKDIKDQDGKGKEQAEKPFELNDVRMSVDKGAFVAIVGRVGSGKSSLLQALIGEMRRTSGNVVFGGSVAYVPQSAWIMNATLRDNITFGREYDEEKFRAIIKACCLEHDLEMLPDAEDTEIGEKGINLSGGQKARVSLARAAYFDADTVLLDDSLSAVDAYVGKSILENCLLSGPLAGKTRILVTHALHVLDKTDYIYVMDNGVIREQGTFQELMDDSVLFSRIMDEYGSQEKEEKAADDEEIKEKEKVPADLDAKKKGQAALMSAEERNTGAVTGETYRKYLRFAGTVLWAPYIVVLLALVQGAAVGNNLFLGFWTAQTINGFSEGQYMAVYAGLGVAQAFFQFLVSFSFSIMTLAAGLRLFKAALNGVLRSPTSFFDTTPMGRIVSRLSKDQDTLDTELSQTAFQLLSTFTSVLGTVALVFYTFPLLGIIFAPLGVLYYAAATYYRRSSVETKRLDSLMRSALYASYSETLTGLSTVRAYREQERFIRNAQQGLDLENRAYYMTVAIQRWLGVRLDLFGNILILGIALFAAGLRTSTNPAKIGVVLSYSLSITQVFSQMVSQYAQNEQNMNAVERVLVYTELPPEGPATTPNDPPPQWPDKGDIQFRNVELAYRKGLPLVLQDVSFHVHAGEKVGIVGRTGAGKSSLLQALFRMVELEGGKIEIDGHNIRDMGLDTLRGRLALVPQDSTLFLGTLRENLDPQNTRTDAELISALQRAWLLPREGPVDAATEAKFGLNASVSDEGGNYSAGEKQLLALCRALVKNSRIIVLDEATSSVDVETDSKLQKTIQTEFASSTLLCIAHRLNTICYYDRVLVMDAGKVAEYDTPLNLFDKTDSIFRSLCNEAKLSREDILRIRAGGHSTSA